MIQLQEIYQKNDFSSLVKEWEQAAKNATTLKLAAKQAFAEAYLSSEGKNETARTSDAELKSHEAALEAELARIEAKAAEFLVEYALTGAKAP
jgi:hypothetical protein